MSTSNSEAVMGNWIALSRDVAGHWLVGFGQAVPPANPNRGAYSRSEAWIDLIMLARWKAGTEVNKGKKIDLEIGQLQGGYSFLALRWNWTLKQVRSFLEKLVIERMIDKGQPEDRLPLACPEDERASKQGKQRGNQIQVITLCNYRKYQIAWEAAKLMEGQAEGKRGASEGQHLNTETKKQGSYRGEEPVKGSPPPPPSVPRNREEEDGDRVGGRTSKDAIKINCATISGPGFVLDLKACELEVQMAGLPIENTLLIAEVVARDWVATKTKVRYPAATFRQALINRRNQFAVDTVRLEGGLKRAREQAEGRPRGIPDGVWEVMKADRARKAAADA